MLTVLSLLESSGAPPDPDVTADLEVEVGEDTVDTDPDVPTETPTEETETPNTEPSSPTVSISDTRRYPARVRQAPTHYDPTGSGTFHVMVC